MSSLWHKENERLLRGPRYLVFWNNLSPDKATKSQVYSTALLEAVLATAIFHRTRDTNVCSTRFPSYRIGLC